MTTENRIDALLPSEMARRAESIGIRKAETKFLPMFTLAILAGAFIGLGAMFSTTILAGGMSVKTASGDPAFTASLPYGVNRLLAGLVFCLGLILVVVSGAELFTGNNLIVMAWASRKISFRALMRNWGVVYLGNFVGSILTALIIFLSKQYTFDNNSVGTMALKIAVSKTSLAFLPALMLGVMCNALVCIAVWMTFSARSVIDKIAAILFPITAFVAAGFEHSVANMYFIPFGLLIKQLDPAFATAFTETTKISLANLTWQSFFINNLIPVTIGNIIGGAVMVAGMYWIIYLRERD